MVASLAAKSGCVLSASANTTEPLSMLPCLHVRDVNRCLRPAIHIFTKRLESIVMLKKKAPKMSWELIALVRNVAWLLTYYDFASQSPETNQPEPPMLRHPPLFSFVMSNSSKSKGIKMYRVAQ